MKLTRRELGTLLVGVAAVAVVRPAGPARAAEETNGWEEALKAFTGGAEASEGGVELVAPEIAENGNTVPIEVAAEGAAEIMVLATANPRPGVVTFEFGPLAGARRGKTRIRLAKTQDLVAVAKMEDGSFRMGKRTVKVTIGGCGG